MLRVADGTASSVASAPITYPRDAVVTIEEVAAALRVSIRTVERMDLKTIYCGRRTRRYLWGQVLDTLAERAQ
jgi:hypothetical protein